MTLNKMLVIGNVGKDPEMRYTPNGSAVTNFSLAVNHKYTPQGGEPQETTEWFDVTAWNRLAETCNSYVVRGMKVYVEGRLQSREWVGDDGQKRFRNQIVAHTVTFLSRPGGQNNGQNGYEGAPASDYQGAPASDYQGAPASDYQGAPASDYQGAPAGGYDGGGHGQGNPPDDDDLPW